MPILAIILLEHDQSERQELALVLDRPRRVHHCQVQQYTSLAGRAVRRLHNYQKIIHANANLDDTDYMTTAQTILAAKSAS